MEHELHTAQERYRASVDEKTRLEEQQAAMQSGHMMLQSQAQQMQVQELPSSLYVTL